MADTLEVKLKRHVIGLSGQSAILPFRFPAFSGTPPRSLTVTFESKHISISRGHYHDSNKNHTYRQTTESEKSHHHSRISIHAWIDYHSNILRTPWWFGQLKNFHRTCICNTTTKLQSSLSVSQALGHLDYRFRPGLQL
jgi:hypothetical protein